VERANSGTADPQLDKAVEVLQGKIGSG
jgi:hypothetical protein